MAELRVRVTPRASRDEILGWVDDPSGRGRVLRLKLKAPPIEGKANAALVRYLAERLGVAKASVNLVSGGKSRIKCLEISGLEDQELADRLSG